MAVITDKFGRPSLPTTYALATTVKTARTPGESVLAAYDLSKYSTDTPVFFITYKKTTDPVTGDVTVTNQTSFKALVNPDNNTFTNLTLAPGYTDIGNDVGDFIECIPTSYWGNSLIEGITAHANPDGTLKTAAVQQALNIGSLPSDYTPLATLPSTIVANGNRSYIATFPGVNYTDRLSPGMRLRTVRSTLAPTQSALLNGTNQYFSRVSGSVAGMTFTNNFVVAAAVKPSAYQQGMILSRSNATNGWYFQQLATGQIEFVALNGGAGNFFKLTSYQSLSLNKWTNNLVAQMDMAVTTNTPTTNYMMLDGVDVPVSCTRGGTNPTALVQGGNLEIGSYNGGTLPFPGKIAQVAIFSAKVTQATMRGYISQGLTGTEANLISAWSLSNSLNDLKTSNANNLTANNGATTTNADSPFGGQADGSISSTVDYGIVQKASYSAPDTTVVFQVAEGCTAPTISGLSAISYSTMKTPYGFPGQIAKWQIINFYKAIATIGTPGTAIYNLGSSQVVVPTGSWRLRVQFTAGVGIPSAGNTHIMTALSASASSMTPAFSGLSGVRYLNAGAALYIIDRVIFENSSEAAVSAATTLYFTASATAGANVLETRNDYSNEGGYIVAENAYL